MKSRIIILLLLLAYISKAQTWEPLVYDSLKSGLELNPLKGFATLFNPDPTNNFPSSIRGRLFGLDTVMLGPNTFDWHAIDNFLTEQSLLGKSSYIQVNIDPAFGKTHLPDYLFPLVDTFYYDDPKVEDPVDDLCPDWNDADLIEAMTTFIDSFGVRYDNDPRIFMVHLGLYGMWGEWHIGDTEFVKPEYKMTEENKTIIANAYKDAFPNTYLLARYPENMPESQDFGYSDGLFFGQSISPDNTFYFHNTLKNNNADLNWKNHPIGGELDPDLQGEIWDNWPNTVGQDVTQSMDSIRPTWIFSHHNFIDQIIEDSPEWNNAIRAQREMGYSFYIDSVRFSALNGLPAIEVNIQNKGLAPMYANWDLELAVLDANNEAFSLGTTKWDINTIQPDLNNNYRSFVSGASLADGTHTFLLRMIDPLESIPNSVVPPFTFANETQDEDITGWITLGEATITGGTLGTAVKKVEGITLSHSVGKITLVENLQLIANVLPTDATNKDVTWTSNKPGYVLISENGLATPGDDYGTSTITAYTQDGGFIAECVITFAPIFVPIPSLIQAEDYIGMSGIVLGSCCGGVSLLEDIDTDDYMEYSVIVDEDAIFTIDFRISSDNADSEISIITEGNDTLIVKNIDNDTWWEDFQLRTSDAFSLSAGEQVLILAASNGGFNIDWLEFKTLPNSFIFLGTTNDQYLIGDNWNTGVPPPNRYPGTITIASNCIVPLEYSIVLGQNGVLNVNEGIEFRVK